MEGQRTRGIGAIAVKYGLIEGVLAFAAFLLAAKAGLRQNWVNAAILVVVMVLAHWEFKKTHHGIMKYSQGVGSGTLLSCVAAVISCVLVFIYLKFINSAYIATIIQTQRSALAQRGITGAQAQQAMAVTAMLRTPVGIAVASLIGGVIAGVIVALIVSIFTQKADPRVVT
jgi:Protein of unknown function (DUF4199)